MLLMMKVQKPLDMRRGYDSFLFRESLLVVRV